ncbi:hypothetical protein D7027_05685 [Ochrobactrum intermedium]|uniref:hypothetical protein n=1 Tax=Brucella intermedia TaxID=94625 RepID=UPI00128D3E29|nr:hypothetical protein [Brucella intermedia]MPR61307.1 hypothetical protein [Brucella intermedia]
MAYFQLQSTFDKGEISPLLGSRADVDFWRASLEYCRNFNVLTHGGLRRRSGTRFIAEVADSNQYTRLLPFRFSEEQSYILALNGGGTMRFLSERAVVGSPYQIGHPFSSGDLSKVSYDQFNDTAYLAHRNYRPRKLVRSGDVNWTLENVQFDDGPYLDRDLTISTKIVPSGLGSPPVSSSSKSTSLTSGYAEFVLSSPVAVDAYWILSVSDNPGNSPSGWKFSGWDGTAWVVLDSQDGEAGWASGERHFYNFTNSAAYSRYRFDWNGAQGSDASKIDFTDIRMHQTADTQTPSTFTASSTAGINNGGGFNPSDVGRAIRIKGASGRWVWVEIKSFISNTQVTGVIHKHGLVDTSPISEWQLGAFSEQSGWPGCVSLFNERLMWARTNSQPVTVFGSKQGNFEDYGVGDTVVETDGLSITLLSSNQNEILWLADDDDLATGSAGQIRTIGPADLNKSFSATNITQRKGPTSGAAQLRPLSIGGVTLYAGIGGTKIRELVLGDQNRYVAPELSLLGEHLFKSGIADWSFCERPDPQIYCAMGDGSLVSVTYDREQKVVGFAKHEIAKGFVESVAVVPGVEAGYDDLYIVVRRTINGQTKRYIEVLERPFDGDIDTIDDSFHVDCGASYNGAPIQTVTGLGFLEGQQVIALADGNVVDSITDDNGTETPLIVSGGAVTLPYAASRISIGLRYLSRAVTLPVAGPQQDGTLFGRNKTVMGAMVDVLNSGSCRLGCAGDKDWQPPITEQVMKRGSELFGSKLELLSGFVPCDLDGSWMQGGGRIVMETDEPLPLLIRSLVMQLESTP